MPNPSTICRECGSSLLERKSMFPTEAFTYLLGVVTGSQTLDWGRIVVAVGEILKWGGTLLHPAQATFAGCPCNAHGLGAEDEKLVSELHDSLVINPAILGFLGQMLLALLAKILGK